MPLRKHTGKLKKQIMKNAPYAPHKPHQPRPPGAPVDGAGHGTSLPGEVVAEVQRVQVEEGAPGHCADGALSYLGKHRVT